MEEYFDIEEYFRALPEDTEGINIDGKNLMYIPSLSRFVNLKIISCSNNRLISLPSLPETLTELYCDNNCLTYLPQLNKGLEILYCVCNKLQWLPSLPETLVELYCYDNNLWYLPQLNKGLEILSCIDNPIHYLICNEDNDNLYDIRKKIQILHNFKELYYSLKFKKQFRGWLWVKIREPKIMQIYNPICLLENLKDDVDLDEFLKNY
jgi:Leucine-rich repeat (LRR) protein